MLDYDGTLAAFQVRPEAARATDGVIRLVEGIVSEGGTTVAIVSGRTLASLIGLVGSLPVTLVAEHGWEMRRPDGRVEQHPIPEKCAAALKSAAAAADREGWGEHVERKRGSVVLHTRALPTERADHLVGAGRRAWEAVAGSGGLRLDAIDGGLELRAPGRNKGAAVRDILAGSPPGSLAVYLGDDVTDEDAFREVEAHGFGIRVGNGGRASRASGRLPSVGAVELFLERWLMTVRGALKD